MTTKQKFHADTIENWIRFAFSFRDDNENIIARVFEQIPDQIMDLQTLCITHITAKEKEEIAYFVYKTSRRRRAALRDALIRSI